MAVCGQCGASTSAKRCPRCGGETNPYAPPRPEAERAPAVAPPAGTTVHLPQIRGEQSFTGSPFPDLPKAGASGSMPVANAQAPTASAEWPPSAPAAPAPVPASAPERTGATAPVTTSGPLTGRSAALLAGAIVLLLVLGGAVWWQMHRTGGPISKAKPAVVKTATKLPEGAVGCPTEDAPDTGWQVFVGNTVTSCQFAQNAAVAIGAATSPMTVEAYSQKAGRSYSMTCKPAPLPNMTCTGGNGAVVYLVPQGVPVVVSTS